MKLNESRALVRDAKRTSRALGGTLYREVVDPNTGERTIKPVWHHGIPATFGVASTENAIASLTGAAGVVLLYISAKNKVKSAYGEKKKRDANIKTALWTGGISAVCFASLLPWRLPAPQGTGASGSRPQM